MAISTVIAPAVWLHNNDFYLNMMTSDVCKIAMNTLRKYVYSNMEYNYPLSFL